MTLIDRLSAATPLLLDGGMGTQLEAAGIEPGGGRNLSHPDAVRAVHEAYAAAGAEALITNTLTLNRLQAAHGGNMDLAASNRAGAELARAALGPRGYVLGDIGATGQMLEPYGDYSEDQFVEIYTEQARALAEGGVDGFILETLYDLREAQCALRACRAVSDLPVLVCMTFQTVAQGGRTMMGHAAADCARALAADGAAAVGANCGEVTPAQMAELIGFMRAATDRPLIAQPNAGLPQVVDGRAVFSMSPADFAAGVAACRTAGATILGGCCGTTPAHIRALASAL